MKSTNSMNFSSLFSSIKRDYLSHDSPISIKINSFFDRFKKKKKREQRTIRLTIPKKVIVDYTKILELPVFDTITVSIIIPAYNGWEMTFKCIHTIIDHTQDVAYEVILADDCSTDATRSISDKIKNMVHCRTDKNEGFLGNCNHAAKQAKGKYLLFLNNDTEVTANWLSPLVALIESDDSIGMVGSKLIYPDGRLQEAGGILWNDGYAMNYGHGQDPQDPEYNYVKEVDYISGASILIKKSLWLRIGGFDERYIPAYYEDTDLAFQVREQGYKVMYQPLSEVIHFEGYSNGTDATLAQNPQSTKAYQNINHTKFAEKWKHVLQGHLTRSPYLFTARDKSIGKKTVLVIDHYVPHFDKDAGSKSTFQYLEVLLQLGLNVKFIGDNFYRHEPYTTALQQLGIEVLYGEWYKKNWKRWIKDNADHINFVILNRPHISVKYIDFIKGVTNAKILYLGHDLHYLREERQYKIEKDPKLLKSSIKWKATEMSIFSRSDITLTFSDVEQTIISALHPAYRVETILLNSFKYAAIPIDDFSIRSNILFIGGFNHRPNVDAVLWFCEKVFPIVKEKIPGIKFIIVGSFPPEEITNLGNDSIEVKGFVTEQELAALYRSAKLAVVPLRYGAGVKGKTVEAMYHGVPVVSTSFGIEGMPGNYTNILSSFDDADSFAAEIIALYADDNALKKASTQQASYVNQYFTQQAAAAKMKMLLEL